MGFLQRWAASSLLTVMWLGVGFVAAQETRPAPQEEAETPAKAAVPAAPAPLRSARATMRTFLEHSNAYLKHQRTEDLEAAAACLDFSQLPAEPAGPQKAELVRQLKGIIDRLAWVDYAKISDDPAGPAFRFPPGQDDQPLTIARGTDGAWRFTAETVAAIGQLWQQYRDRPLVVSSTPWYRQMIPLIGNEPWRIGALFLSLLVAFVIGQLLRQAIAGAGASMDRRGRAVTASTLKALARSVAPLVWVVGLTTGLKFLVLNLTVSEAVDTVVSILFVIAVAYVAYCLVDVVDAWLRSFSQRTRTRMDDMLVPMVRTSLRATIVVLLLVQVATILSDKPVTSIIAGLGVGGLAVGLAAQDAIKNFFGSIMIFSDRPFELGDRIVVDGHDGPVEAVGFRSTRIRTLDGHLVTIPNGELANKTILNISKRPSIRRIMNVTVTYDTPPEKVERAVEILKDILKDHEGMHPDFPPRVFFNELSDTALNIFVIYWYHPPDYWAFCAFNERVNMELLRRFNQAGIEFAFPTQTVFLAGDPNRPLSPPSSTPPGAQQETAQQ